MELGGVLRLGLRPPAFAARQSAASARRRQPRSGGCRSYHSKLTQQARPFLEGLEDEFAEDDVIPADAVCQLAIDLLVGGAFEEFLLTAQRLAVEEEFGLVAGGVNMDGRDLINALQSVPVRQNVGHGEIGTPPGPGGSDLWGSPARSFVHSLPPFSAVGIPGAAAVRRTCPVGVVRCTVARRRPW